MNANTCPPRSTQGLIRGLGREARPLGEGGGLLLVVAVHLRVIGQPQQLPPPLPALRTPGAAERTLCSVAFPLPASRGHGIHS